MKSRTILFMIAFSRLKQGVEMKQSVSLRVSMAIPENAVAVLMQRSQEKLKSTLQQAGIDDSSISMVVESPFTELKMTVSIQKRGSEFVQKAVQEAMGIVMVEFGLPPIAATVAIGEQNTLPA